MKKTCPGSRFDFAILCAIIIAIAACIGSSAFAYGHLTLALSLVSLVLPALVCWAAMKSDDIFNPFCIFSGFFALYNGLILLRLSSPDVRSRLLYPVAFNGEDYWRAGLLSAISAIAIGIAWLTCKKVGVRRSLPSAGFDSPAHLYYRAGFIGVLIGFGAELIKFWQAGGVLAYLTESRIDTFDPTASHPAGLPAMPFVIAGLSLMVYGARPSLSHARLFWGAIVIWTAVLLMRGDRRPILQMGIAVLFSWSVTVPGKIRVKVSTVFFVAAIYVAAILVGQFREFFPLMLRGEVRLETAFSWGVNNFNVDWVMPENTEFGAPYLSTLTAVSSNSLPLYGHSYALSLISIVPRVLYPGTKPMTLADQFATDVARGTGAAQGWGFNPAAEAYMNFRWLGTPIVMFAWALFFIAMNRLRDYRPLGLMIGAALASEAVNANRIDFSTIYLESVHCLLAAVIVFSLVAVSRLRGSKVNYDLSRNSRPANSMERSTIIIAPPKKIGHRFGQTL
jgi:hypothetical protein